MHNQRIAFIVASVVALVPATSAGLFHPKNIFGNIFLLPGVEILEQIENRTLIPSPTTAATPAVAPVLGNRWGGEVFATRIDQMQTFGDQCPRDFINDYEKNEDICRRCTEYYDGDERMGNLCRQNCFTSCYYVRCKNMMECHIPYSFD